ncbi:MAG: DegT/DnrJ/EryC1/StrS family aminotransferase [Lachnospiraceae bacterium]|nr:DegT/DnrJ/EryC1/StrS family aminotransferase [Lachnospiraceae bacterium]
MQFRDLQRQYEHIKDQIDSRVSSVVTSSRFISGPEVKELESVLAEYVGVKHCITCANGTDAISIALMAHGVGEGDAVFVPDFTFFSSGECPATVGATPVFVDVDDETYNMNPVSLEAAVEAVIKEGQYKPKAVVAVDLFGQPFDVPAIKAVCKKYDLLLLEDGAQGFGGSYKDDSGVRMACSLGDIATTSFFPAKPLGCYGDGGAIFTNDDNIALLCRSIAVHGKDTQNLDDPNAKYNNIRLGLNSRLDTLQAGVVLGKFDTFKDEELEGINKVADKYSQLLGDVSGIKLPVVKPGMFSSWAQYTLQLPEGADRAAIQKRLKDDGIPTNIYYIKPMHLQGAFAGTRSAVATCPITEKLCKTVLCLPIHPYLTDSEIELVAAKLKEAIG